MELVGRVWGVRVEVLVRWFYDCLRREKILPYSFNFPISSIFCPYFFFVSKQKLCFAAGFGGHNRRQRAKNLEILTGIC